jgi:HlyD family secretion protein
MVLQAQATVKETRSQLARLRHARVLSGNRVPSQQDLDAAQAALDRAVADEAASRASVKQAEATLELNQTDLAKADIRSPIDGVVLTRSVEPGQTVAASLQAPVLFTLAEDLSKMELHVDVDEADVGKVHEGQRATFTVDAYPERSFPARISQVRYGSQTVDGVVTYETVLSVDNSDLSLRPGMTATAEITVQTVKDALLVPDAALRWVPPRRETRSSGGAGLLGALLPRLRHHQAPSEDSADSKRKHVWVLRGGTPERVAITVGASDGTRTVVTGGKLAAGDSLVVDSATSTAR